MDAVPVPVNPLPGVRSGDCAAWPLPPDATCARVARSVVREVLTALRQPDELIYTATTLVSELATNAFQHAFAGAETVGPGGILGLPELWLYRRSHPAAQLVITVFDTSRHWKIPSGPSGGAASAERGRGLEIVAALSTAWGVRPTRSRQGPRGLLGKAVWAALPMNGDTLAPAGRPDTPSLDHGASTTAYHAMNALETLLCARGITPAHRTDTTHCCVLSLRPELTVWADTTFRWQGCSTASCLRRPFRDVVDVTEQLISRYDEIDAPIPWTPGAHRPT